MSSIKVSVRVVKVRKVVNKVCSVRGPVGVSRATQTTTPTCTPIILDGLAVKCVMWGRSVC